MNYIFDLDNTLIYSDLANAQKQQIAATKVKSNIRQKAVATSDNSVQLAIEFKD